MKNPTILCPPFPWRHIIVDTVMWRCRTGYRTCEARYGDTTIVIKTSSILGITEDKLTSLICGRRFSVRSKHFIAWLKPHSLKIVRSEQFK